MKQLFLIFLSVFLLCGIACAEDNVTESDVADAITMINPAEFTSSSDGVLFAQDVNASEFNVTINNTEEKITVSLDEGAESAHTQIIGVPLTVMPSYNGYLFVQHFDDSGICDGYNVVQPVIAASYAYLEVNFSTVTITPLVSQVVNWQFESWYNDNIPSSWSYSGTDTPRKSTDSAIDTYACKITTLTGGTLTQTTTLTPGYYTIAAWAKCTSGTSGTLNIDLYGGSPSADSSGALLQASAEHNVWHYIERREYVNSSNPQLRIFVDGSPDEGSTWLVDGIIVSPDYSYTANESDDRSHIYMNFTFTPAVDLDASWMSVSFINHDLSTENISNVTAKIDGYTVATEIVGNIVYVDTSWFDVNPHQVNITINYTPQPPVVAFTANTSYAGRNSTVQFTDMSTGYIDSWYWDFGDGNNSTLQNPAHVYTTNGVYTVTLSVTGPGGTTVLPYGGAVSVTEVAANNYSQYYQNFFTPEMGGWDFVSHTSDFWNTLLPSEFFWLIVLLIPYLTIYNRTQSIIIPAVLYLFIGGALALVMPPILAQFYYWFIILGTGGVMYKMFIGD